ncbi:MAG TPA: Bax inhibitor-1 family protein [Opitutaceae bacterium]|nr:Bax inhibitor-1 family protein [Opitutaceae bacterium]
MMYSSTQSLAPVAEALPIERAQFIRRTYLHLAAAILAFTGLETVLLHTPGVEGLVNMMLGRGWLITLALFIGVSYLADRWARSEASKTMQYVGLGLYVVVESIVFLPLLYIAAYYSSPEVVPMAGIITGLLFAGLTSTAFITRKDFSFLGGILTIGGFIALGVIVCSILFGFQLGLLFSGAMVFFAGASILYTTSNMIHHYRPDQYVAASLALFSGVMLLFWYVLRFVMGSRRN